MARRRLELVVCAAPIAAQAPLLARELVSAGWEVSVTMSLNAASWVDRDAVDSIGSPRETRKPGESRPGPPAAVIVAPATFNTLNKLRAGISDTPALGVLNDAVGQHVPILVVPMISERLIHHPAWAETARWLEAIGVTMLDPTTGRGGSVAPLASGSGEAVAERFQPSWLTSWAASVTSPLRLTS